MCNQFIYKLLSPLLLGCFVTNAQEIKGRISSAEEALSYAQVLLVDALDTTLVYQSTLSDNNGDFVFTASNTQKYRVQITAFNHHTYRSEAQSPPHDFGVINLQKEDISLEAVEIKVEKKLLEREGNVLHVKPANSPVTSGGSTLEALSKVPGLIVNQDGSLSLKGKNNVQIFIDGKASLMSLENLKVYLENTPASEIEQIEVHEVPPVKFDAAGNGGIINIVLKKTTYEGKNGSVNLNAGYGNQHKFGPSGRFNYKKEALLMYANMNYYHNKTDYWAAADMHMEYNETNRRYLNQYFPVFTNEGGGVKTGLSYEFNSKHEAGISLNYQRGSSIGKENALTQVINYTSFNEVIALRTFKFNWDNWIVQSNYRYQANNKQQFDWENNVIWRNHQHLEQNLNQFYLYQNKSHQSLVEMLGGSNLFIALTQLDYENTQFNHHPFTAGIKSTYIQSANELSFYEGTNTSDLAEQSEFSNRFNYLEWINAGYAQLSSNWNKVWKTTVAMRMEHTHNVAFFPRADSVHTRSYTQFFPLLTINYQKNNNHLLSFSVNRRVDRPNYADLNPFVTKVNEFTYYKGNPYLIPQTTQSFTLSHLFKNTFHFSINAALTKNALTRIIEQDNLQQIQFAYTANIDYINNYNLNVSLPFKPLKCWQFNFNSTVYYNQIKAQWEVKSIQANLTSFTIQAQNQFNFGKGFSAEFSGFYNHNSYWNIWFVEPHYKMDIGLNKKHKQWGFTLSVLDFLNLREGNGGVYLGGIYMDTQYKPESRIVQLSVLYNFGSVYTDKKTNSTQEVLKRVD